MSISAFLEGFQEKCASYGLTPETLMKSALFSGSIAGARESKDPSLLRRIAHGGGADVITSFPGAVAGGAIGGALGGPPGAITGGAIGGSVSGSAGTAFTTQPTNLKWLIQRKLRDIARDPESVRPNLTDNDLVSKAVGGGAYGMLGGGALGALLGLGTGAALGHPVTGLSIGAPVGAAIGAPLGSYYAGLRTLPPKELNKYRRYLEKELGKLEG